MTDSQRTLALGLLIKLIGREVQTLKQEAMRHHDQKSMMCLFCIAEESAGGLAEVVDANPQLAAEIARNESMWPMFYAGDSVSRKLMDRHVEPLELGKNHHSIFAAKNMLSEFTLARRWLYVLAGVMEDVRAESNAVKQKHRLIRNDSTHKQRIMVGIEGIPDIDASAQEVNHYIQSLVLTPEVLRCLAELMELRQPLAKDSALQQFIYHCRVLPVLRAEKSVVKRWIMVIRELLMEVYQGHPEQSPLRSLGEYLARGNVASSPLGSRSYESNLRAGIFQRLEKTLFNIAKAQ